MDVVRILSVLQAGLLQAVAAWLKSILPLLATCPLLDVYTPDYAARKAALEYTQNVLDTVPTPMLVLDGQLRVQTASRSSWQTFQVSAGDTEVELIYELGNGQWNIPCLRELLEIILPQRTVFNGFEVMHDFPTSQPSATAS